MANSAAAKLLRKATATIRTTTPGSIFTIHLDFRPSSTQTFNAINQLYVNHFRSKAGKPEGDVSAWNGNPLIRGIPAEHLELCREQIALLASQTPVMQMHSGPPVSFVVHDLTKGERFRVGFELSPSSLWVFRARLRDAIRGALPDKQSLGLEERTPWLENAMLRELLLAYPKGFGAIDVVGISIGALSDPSIDKIPPSRDIKLHTYSFQDSPKEVNSSLVDV
ncbi:uncharacterized protein RAG0_13845 [Rhynchosporium agropyri]|uniref:Uncharacterized protein n=1 Tax=Rhynchosporium agropyri TaxID=914238 RepID=A0A1E1LEE3_9HELO|nr:uncharacterized protein RAG0_13845 [Rhynchosporium agropyri]